jgi:hypothetical protein
MSDHHLAIDLLRDMRDVIELAMRPPGELITITRQDAEAILDDLGAVARLVRKLAEAR